ncbi:hypothetical protein R6V09_00665 [Streptomyces sp. W16]|uniref:hypothetical protein n=1 Tax=Streptomyces sp. W16 TaxID=3076631 RepID=UPI00295BE9EF|nr:hypothetical protein [Streptomyces sp. W16]MDV9168655.1 hypothetical protein [Streptomyces sp. W16]
MSSEHEQDPAVSGDQQGREAQPSSERGQDRRQLLQQRFIESLLAHGEAVPEGQEVPEDATHELRRDEEGNLIAHRRHFSAF